MSVKEIEDKLREIEAALSESIRTEKDPARTLVSSRGHLRIAIDHLKQFVAK